jgi:mannitol-1-phosphate 5-dehydrogenase
LSVVKAALQFQNVPGDDESVELAKILKELDADAATEKITGLEKDHPLYAKVSAVVAEVQGK